MVEIDTAELKGKRFRCIEGCGLCCLCQPELLPSELEFFRRDQALSRVIVKSQIDSSKRAIAMLGNGGPCSLLHQRKCTIYDRRPHFCRQFPVHTHLMWRIQLTPDYSCRGIWSDSADNAQPGLADLEKYGLDELKHYSESRLESELADAREVFEEFRKNSVESSVWAEHQTVREKTLSLIEDGYFSTIEGLGSVLAAVERSRDHDLEVIDVLRTTGGSRPIEAARIALGELAEEMLTVDDVSENPIYVDKELNWNIHTLANGRVVRRRILDSGDLGEAFPLDITVDSMTLHPGGDAALRKYARITNARDAFLGFVYYLVDDSDYEVDVFSTYLENMAMTQLDLLYRSALSGNVHGTPVTAEHIAEGVIYIDMDMHDAPTIGSVI